MAFTGIEAPLRVKSIPIGPIRILAEHFGRLARRELDQPVLGNVAENQKARRGPRGSFSENKACGNFVHPDGTEILRGGASGEQQDRE
jgi:hypothetical protein